MARHRPGAGFARWLRLQRILIVRRTVRRLHDWHQWLPSWGTSVLVHAIALLILALIYFSTGSGPRESQFNGEFTPGPVLGEGLISSVPAEVAGDPFNTNQTKEFPSLSFDTVAKGTKIINQPALPADVKFTHTITPPRVAAMPGVKLSDTVGSRLHFEDLSAPFAGRDEATRAKLVRREGGSAESEKAVQAGLDWIARHQRPDGAWSLDYHGQCVDDGCPFETTMASDTAATGLGLLPLLGAGHIHTKECRYQDNVRRGLAFLMKNQSPEGELFLGGSGNTKFYSHAIAAMALCEAYGISNDPRLKIPAQRALNFIAKNQNLDDGGWRYFPGQSGDTSVFGWQMFALRSGKLAGLEVSKRTIAGCRKYLDRAATDKGRTAYSYLIGGPADPVMTAEALLCRQYLGWPNDYGPLLKGAKSVYDHLLASEQRDIYYWYYATQMLHNLQGKEWVSWNKRIRDGLVGMQVTGVGCAKGSWDPQSPQRDRRSTAGRLYVTSLSILTLEVYYRWLPLYKPVDRSEDGNEKPPLDDEKSQLAKQAVLEPAAKPAQATAKKKAK